MANHHLILAIAIVTCIVHQSAVQSLTVTNIPAYVTAQTGTSTLLNCQPETSYTGIFAWRSIGTSVSGDVVFLTRPYKSYPKFPPERFHPYGDFGMNITSLRWSDGGTYDCSFLDDDAHGLVDVVVVDLPSSLVNPSALNAGDIVTFNCSVGFGGPINNTDVISPDQFPQLQIKYGGEDLTQQAPLQYFAGKPNVTQHRMTRTIQRQVTSSDIRKQLTCTVFTKTPWFTLSTSADVNIRTPASDIVVTPQRSQYAFNDVINCTASGYPPPTVNWIRINSSSQQQGFGSVLVVTEDMKGYNIWQCVANNLLNTQPVVVELRFMAGDYVAPETPTIAKSNAGLAVGLAIGISALVIIIIVVVVIICRRRRAHAKPAEKTNEADSHPFIYKPNASRQSASAEDDAEQRPVAKPRVASANTTLDTSAGGFADLGARSINASTDSLHKVLDTKVLDTDVGKARSGEKSRRKANPRGSTESLDKSLEESGRPVPKERPKTDFRGSSESLDRSIDNRPQPKERPKPNLRASNESLDRSVESSARLIQPDRSRLSSDHSFDGGVPEQGGKPRPPTAPKPNKAV